MAGAAEPSQPESGAVARNELVPSPCRGQVGIGTLIVFVAMVLVASIAAGVLIETAGLLQSQSEATGEQSSQAVTDRVTVVSTVGIVGNVWDPDPGNEVEEVELKVKRAPGGGDIDLADAVIHFVGPRGSDDLTHLSGGANALEPGTDNFATAPVKGTGTTLSSDTDIIKIILQFDGDPDPMSVFEPGESGDIEIVTADGGRTHVRVTIPNSLADESAVDV